MWWKDKCLTNWKEKTQMCFRIKAIIRRNETKNEGIGKN